MYSQVCRQCPEDDYIQFPWWPQALPASACIQFENRDSEGKIRSKSYTQLHLCQQIASLKVTLSECTCLLEYVCVWMCYQGSAKMMGGGNSASPETCECVYASILVSTILAELNWGVNGIPIFCKRAGGGCDWEKDEKICKWEGSSFSPQ